MKFSKNFSRAEIEHSNTAKRLGISNEMSEEHMENMQRLITNLIQPMRDAIGPIRVTSGYRSKALNSAIGGSNRSQHSKGQALDLQFWSEGKMNNKVIYDWILNSGLDFDQIINEFDFAWIHISLKDKNNRKQNLEAYKNEKGKTKYRYADI
tara:strand:+ start:479 stop:934 length:456 start_codon:yes stop_codon:yes gene_type:complete